MPTFSRSRGAGPADAPFRSQAAVEEVLDALLEPLFPVRKGIRLLGVTLSSLGDETQGRERQLRLSI